MARTSGGERLVLVYAMEAPLARVANVAGFIEQLGPELLRKVTANANFFRRATSKLVS